MIFFELEASDISSLNDGDLRNLVARLCEAELIQQGIQSSCVTWGGAQEAADGGLDVNVKSNFEIPNPNFVPRANTGFQVKKHSMGKSACRNEMQEGGKPKAAIENLASQKGAYIIVSGKDDCSDKMLSERLGGMKKAVAALQGNDDLHLDFYGRDRLSAWLRRHPSVALWMRLRLGKPLAGWMPYGRWAATPLDQDDEFLADDHPCVIDANSSSKDPRPVSDGIKLARDRLREPGSTVRITGLSGVGKTRFAQALFEDKVGLEALPASDVIYADLGTDLSPTASELVTYLIANGLASYLILDNCPPDVHRGLQKRVAASGAKLRLLTIEYDISEDKPEETQVIHLEPNSEEAVSKLVQKRAPDLGPISANRIAEFAGGNARLALALASRVQADETLSNFSDEDLFRRLFAQRKGESPELLRGAEALALVYSFNVSRTERDDELSVLGAIAGLTRQALHRDQAELLRRQLAQQRGNWRAILPHALANRLAKRALQNIPAEDINAELFNNDNLRLFQSCAHRLGYLHDCTQARELALTWVRPGAPLGNIAACNDKYLVVLDHVAPVFPDVVLRAIEQASIEPGFASRANGNFTRFVWLLCHLAYDDETFDSATEILLKFAETEKAGENNNSIVRQMRQLFSLHLSGTEATPKRRQAFVRKLLDSGDPRHREIAGELLRSAFESHHWTSFGTLHFGARKRGPGWCPKTRGEEIDWYVGYIQLLQPSMKSPQPKSRDWAKSMLADHFRSLWTFAGCFDALEQIIRDHRHDGNWPEMWISIKKTLHFDGPRHAPELLARLESLEKLTAPSDMFSEIEAYALVDAWDHIELRGEEFQERTNEIYEKVFKLGELAASELGYLDRLGAKLWETSVQSLSWFGRGLAAGAADKLSMFDHLVDSFRRHQSERVNIFLLDGFIRGVHDSDPPQARQILEHALGVPELKSYAIGLLAIVPVIHWVSERLLDLAMDGELEAWRFEQLGYGRIHEAISDGELAAILTKINALNRGYLSTIKILSMRLFGMEDHEYTPSDELLTVAREAVRRLLSVHRAESNQVHLHQIGRVLEEAFSPSAPESEIREIIDLLCKGVQAYSLYAFELTDIITLLVKRYPELFLGVVFDGSEKEHLCAASLFKHRVGREEPTLNDAPLNRVMAWCGDDQDRIVKVAKAMEAYRPSDPGDASDDNPRRIVLSEHIKSLLEAATDKLAIVEIIFKDIHPSSWSGSLAAILDSRSKAFAELLNERDPNVQDFVRIKLSQLEQEIRREREREASEHNEREQRFE
ncbi:hypothetical protein ACFPK0_03140 [Rhodanobacter ginsenosidimutans]|uniref:Restriction endonuclease type IV Mrr domain-containing protein n=2 Tax=Rhodanobacter ginsenosidimutans TaxID=490571 RepID=A0ABW0JSJ1_9GAMM